MSTNAGRANPFADIDELPAFQPKPKAVPRHVEREHIDRIAEANNFPSRQPTPPPPAAASPMPVRSARRYKTGRNQQINIKATADVIQRLYKLADARHVPLGKLLEEALEALESTAGQGSDA
jgi:hypothetical protein